MKYVTDDEWESLLNYLIDDRAASHVLGLLNLGRRLPRVCAAEDCRRFFIPDIKNMDRHRFCSDRCRSRLAKRRERSKRKTGG